MIKTYFFENLHWEYQPVGNHETVISVVDNDTFTAAQGLDNACCLNFASHKRPGGGYESVRNLKMPIRTQEEDLFRRSNLPELMDIPEVRKHYPLRGLNAIYTSEVMVCKDKNLDPIEPFEVAIITMPAVVNPKLDDAPLICGRIGRILAIAADQGHENLVLGAWGCGVFNNDPRFIAGQFRDYFTGLYQPSFQGVFRNVVFAIPGKDSDNHRIFKEALDGKHHEP